ncbi:MAG: hypothetical protein GQ467_06240 [Mariprofundaceae bacterium]|nr:hypothetical protein [Mariprofundaceae bacterium]
MHIFRFILVVLVALSALPAVAQEEAARAGDVVVEEATTPSTQERIEELKAYRAKSEREGPATATDKIVDRFMALNTNPEESIGVDFEEYFIMVMQRATDRFDAMDADQDDEVTEEEYREFWKAQKAQYYRLKR